MVLNIADLRTIHSREALQTLRDRFGDRVFDSVIRSSIRYAESAERGVSILDYRPELGADYLSLPRSCSSGSASTTSACAWRRSGASSYRFDGLDDLLFRPARSWPRWCAPAS